MSLRIGIYDFFSYTLPGALYVVTTVHLLQLTEIIKLDFAKIGLSITQVIILSALSYVTGMLFDALSSKTWYRLFKPINVPEKALSDFKNK